MSKLYIFTMALCFLLLSLPFIGWAGDHRLDVRGLGMGRTDITTSHSIDAMGTNPANLGLDSSVFSTSLLPTAGFALGSTTFDFNLYSTYFTGNPDGTPTVLSETDKEEILHSLDGDASNLGAHIDIRIFAAALRLGAASFGIDLSDHLSYQVRVPNDYFHLVLEGNQAGRQYDLSQMQLSAIWYREYGLGFARTTVLSASNQLLYGIHAKMIQGFGYFGFHDNATRISIHPDRSISAAVAYTAREAGTTMFSNFGHAISLFPSPAGTGFGIDLGMTFLLEERWRIGVAVNDIGTITWTQNARRVQKEKELQISDPLLSKQMDILRDLLSTHGTPEDGFSSPLPTTISAGASYHAAQILFGVETEIGLAPEEFFQSAWRISAGAEYSALRAVPIRTGLAFDRIYGWSWAAGFGLYVGGIRCDIGTEHLDAVLTPSSFRHLSFAFSTRWDLQ